MTIMTFVDVFVFCWRERPWRHIPGSDGTFVGSFMWWRFCFGGAWSQERRMSRVPSFMPRADEVDDETVGSGETGLFAKLKDWTMRRKQPSSRGSDTSTAPAASSSRPRPKVNPHMRTFSGGSDRRHLEVERAHERLALERAEYEQNRRSLQERRASVISGQQQSASPAVKKERKDSFDDA
jgi:G protein-coupled receptor GPR1